MIIPKQVMSILEQLKEKGFQAFIVGGCLRDLLREEEPQDWDIATDANPEQIQEVFPKSFRDNNFGTVTVLTGAKKESLKEVEITPFRTEAKYSDKRHPDKVVFAKTIEEDLSRRDFTINAMAKDKDIIDPYSGQEDLKEKIIRAVRDPDERFSEDALRMIRAVRFACVLGFAIEEKTKQAIKKNSMWLKMISKERIRDEFLKIIMSDKADEGINLLKELNLLRFIAPELEEGCGVGQNKHHIYGCYEHSILSLKYAAEKKFNLYVRLASLFHDIAKPRVKRGDGLDSTFYGHEIVGARMTKKILEDLRFSNKDIEKIVRLVRYHLFYYNTGEVSESSVRRLVKNVGTENMGELLQVRMADRIGSGVPKAEPYKLRHLKYIIDKVSQDPISAKMLKINGNDIMKLLKEEPGPKIGQILDILLSFVLLDPKKNKKEILIKEAEKLGKLKNLKEIAEKSKMEVQEIETKKDKMTKGKYWVS